MRGFLALLFLGLVALGAGAVGYHVGLSSAVGAVGPVAVHAGVWPVGALLLLPFAFFLVPLLFISFFGFLGFALGPHRRFRDRWADDRGYGPMGFGRRDRWDARHGWVAEAHRRLHEEEARAASVQGAAGSPSQPAPGASGAPSSVGGGPAAPGGPGAA